MKTVQCKPHISKSGDFENVVNKFESIVLVGKFSYLFHLILMEETMTKSENWTWKVDILELQFSQDRDDMLLQICRVCKGTSASKL